MCEAVLHPKEFNESFSSPIIHYNHEEFIKTHSGTKDEISK